MILTSYIKTLEYLDNMMTEIIQNNPFPITFEDDISLRIRNIQKAQKQIIKQLAESVGLKTYE